MIKLKTSQLRKSQLVVLCQAVTNPNPTLWFGGYLLQFQTKAVSVNCTQKMIEQVGFEDCLESLRNRQLNHP